ncbi:MAG: hypothetical protein ACRBBK_07545 [Paracoccaceae bacterium]
MTYTSVLLNGFSLGHLAPSAPGSKPPSLLAFDPRAVICLRVIGSSEEEDITHSSYIDGIEVFGSGRAYVENRPLFRYAPHTKWHAAPVRHLSKDRGLVRFEFEATSFKSPDPGAPKLRGLFVSVGEDIRPAAKEAQAKITKAQNIFLDPDLIVLQKIAQTG